MAQAHVKAMEKFFQDHKELSSTEQLRFLRAEHNAIKQQIVQNVCNSSSGIQCDECGYYKQMKCQGCGQSNSKYGYLYHQGGRIFCFDCKDISRAVPSKGHVFAIDGQFKCECKK